MVAGVLILNKPSGITSAQALNDLKKKLKLKKVGHAGTLDKMAQGVLLVCMGKATKIVEDLQELNKFYRVWIKFGIKTDTVDLDGDILEERKDIKLPDKKTIEEILSNFKGIYMQKIPVYSAAKFRGKRFSDLAREGKKVPERKKEVKVYSIIVDEIDYKNNEVVLDIETSKGFYVRQFVEDFSAKLNTVAVMKKLVRTAVGEFDLMKAVDLEKLNREVLFEKILPIDKALYFYPAINFDFEDKVRKFLNGAFINIDIENLYRVKVYSDEGDFLGIGTIENYKLKPLKILGNTC